MSVLRYRYSSNVFRLLLSFVLDRKPCRIKMPERLFQLFQLCGRTVHFHPSEIAHCEHFRQQIADVVEVCENAFGVRISFTAKNFVAVNSKPVEKIIFSSVLVFSTKRENPALTSSSFPGCTFEIGMQADES